MVRPAQRLTMSASKRALCGHAVMSSPASSASWGYVGHLRERYCDVCVMMAIR